MVGDVRTLDTFCASTNAIKESPHEYQQSLLLTRIITNVVRLHSNTMA